LVGKKPVLQKSNFCFDHENRLIMLSPILGPSSRDVEAVEYFLLPVPAPYKLNHFRVYFRFKSDQRNDNKSKKQPEMDNT